MVQLFFENNQEDVGFYNSWKGVFEPLNSSLNDFEENAYCGYKLADIIINNKLIELTQAIPKDVFRTILAEVINSWRYVGNFESYISVFKAIWGENTEISFTKKAPGVLEIDLVIEVSEYFMVTQEDEFIVCQGDEHLVFTDLISTTDYKDVKNILQSLTPVGSVLIFKIKIK